MCEESVLRGKESNTPHRMRVGPIGTPMKCILLICSFAVSSELVLGADISIGGTAFSVPAPAGYALVTNNMKPYSEFAMRFVPPSNMQFALFLPEAEAACAARGEMPNSVRRFYVQTAKIIVEPFVSTADFAEMKQSIKARNAEILKKAEAEIPGLLDEVSRGISEDYIVDLNLSMNQMLPFDPHYETERALAYSMIMKYNVNDENGRPSVFEAVGTLTLVHLKGKILFLYANAEKAGLDWSRAESRKWADMLIAANPSVGDIAAREASPARHGFDWQKVVERAILGAIIGGIVGAIGYVFGKNKKA